MPASHFDVNSMTGRPKFIVRHSTIFDDIFTSPVSAAILLQSWKSPKLSLFHWLTKIK
jgi:hypothetical protein